MMRVSLLIVLAGILGCSRMTKPTREQREQFYVTANQIVAIEEAKLDKLRRERQEMADHNMKLLGAAKDQQDTKKITPEQYKMVEDEVSKRGKDADAGLERQTAILEAAYKRAESLRPE
jgi:hypothetical protein